MSDDIWIEASADHESEARLARVTSARIAAQDATWDFLSRSESLIDYDNRRSVMATEIAEAVRSAVEPQHFDETMAAVHDSFIRDIAILIEDRQRQAYAARLAALEHRSASSLRYDVAKDVLDNGIFDSWGRTKKLEGAILDALTAGALVKVYEALSPENQAKFDSIPLDKLINFIWKSVSVGAKTADGDASISRSRVSIPTQLRESGHTVETGGSLDSLGRIVYIIDGEEMGLKEAADRFLGGWENAFGKGGSKIAADDGSESQANYDEGYRQGERDRDAGDDPGYLQVSDELTAFGRGYWDGYGKKPKQATKRASLDDRFAAIGKTSSLDDILVFTHKQVGYKTYQVKPDEWATYWGAVLPNGLSSPSGARVQLFKGEGGIGMIAETVPVSGDDEAEQVIRRMLNFQGSKTADAAPPYGWMQNQGKPISDSRSSWSLNPETDNWIGNFTDEALSEALTFWESPEGVAAQPHLDEAAGTPGGYAGSAAQMIRDEQSRRTASKTAAVKEPYANAGGLNTFLLQAANNMKRNGHELGPWERKDFDNVDMIEGKTSVYIKAQCVKCGLWCEVSGHEPDHWTYSTPGRVVNNKSVTKCDDLKKASVRMAVKPRDMIAGEGAYVTDAHNSGIRKEVPAGTIAHPEQAYGAFWGGPGAVMYDWSVEGISGEGWQLGGVWIEKVVVASRRTASVEEIVKRFGMTDAGRLGAEGGTLYKGFVMDSDFSYGPGPGAGWTWIEKASDPPFNMVWANTTDLAIFSYTEGDLYLEVFKGPMEFGVGCAGYIKFREKMSTRTSTRKVASDLDDAVDDYSEGTRDLKVGDRIGTWTITEVGTHTVQATNDEGWSTSVQTTFIDGQGGSTPAHQRSLNEITSVRRKRAAIGDVTTWADGFGNWHARVTETGNAVGNSMAAEAAALEAIRSALAEREGPDFAPEVVGVKLVNRSSHDGLLESEFVETNSNDGKFEEWDAAGRPASASKTAGNPFAVGTSDWFEWEYGDDGKYKNEPGHGPSSGVPEDLFPEGGVPLHGDLSPEQEKWLHSRSFKVRARKMRVGSMLTDSAGYYRVEEVYPRGDKIAMVVTSRLGERMALEVPAVDELGVVLPFHRGAFEDDATPPDMGGDLGASSVPQTTKPRQMPSGGPAPVPGAAMPGMQPEEPKTPLTARRTMAIVDPNQLNTMVEFDSPFEVTESGDVNTSVPGVYAPSVYEYLDEDGQSTNAKPEIDGSGWDFVDGYSGQDRYSGPVMHPSEQLAGGMARDVLEDPGIYVVTEVTNPEDPEDMIGWVLLKKTGSTKTADERDRATRPRYGDQTMCRNCDADIEYHGGEAGWIDRGGNTYCDESGMAKWDGDGQPIALPHTKHKPYSDRVARIAAVAPVSDDDVAKFQAALKSIGYAIDDAEAHDILVLKGGLKSAMDTAGIVSDRYQDVNAAGGIEVEDGFGLSSLVETTDPTDWALFPSYGASAPSEAEVREMAAALRQPKWSESLLRVLDPNDSSHQYWKGGSKRAELGEPERTDCPRCGSANYNVAAGVCSQCGYQGEKKTAGDQPPWLKKKKDGDEPAADEKKDAPADPAADPAAPPVDPAAPPADGAQQPPVPPEQPAAPPTTGQASVDQAVDQATQRGHEMVESAFDIDAGTTSWRCNKCGLEGEANVGGDAGAAQITGDLFEGSDSCSATAAPQPDPTKQQPPGSSPQPPNPTQASRKTASDYDVKRSGIGNWVEAGDSWDSATAAARRLVDPAQQTTVLLVRNNFNASVSVLVMDTLGHFSVQTYEQFFGHPYAAAKARIEAMARGIQASNPGMPEAEARAVAERTIERYPQVVSR